MCYDDSNLVTITVTHCVSVNRLLFQVKYILCICAYVAVRIGNTDALLGRIHSLICVLEGSDATDLQYRWRLGDVVLEDFSSFSDLLISVTALSARDDYHCDVRIPGRDDLITGTGSLHVTS